MSMTNAKTQQFSWCSYGATLTLSSPLGGTLLTNQSTGQLSRPCCSTLSIIFYVRQSAWKTAPGWYKPTVAIIDSFKGQITETVTSQLETNNVHVCLLPPNTTDLQSMDFAVNKLEKTSCTRSFSSGTRSTSWNSWKNRMALIFRMQSYRYWPGLASPEGHWS